MSTTRLLTLYVEVVRDHRSSWQPVRTGRTWTRRPDKHDGRLLELVAPPTTEPLANVSGSIEALQ